MFVCDVWIFVHPGRIRWRVSDTAGCHATCLLITPGPRHGDVSWHSWQPDRAATLYIWYWRVFTGSLGGAGRQNKAGGVSQMSQTPLTLSSYATFPSQCLRGEVRSGVGGKKYGALSSQDKFPFQNYDRKIFVTDPKLLVSKCHRVYSRHLDIKILTHFRQGVSQKWVRQRKIEKVQQDPLFRVSKYFRQLENWNKYLNI